jgi:hypothetical protein
LFDALHRVRDGQAHRFGLRCGLLDILCLQRICAAGLDRRLGRNCVDMRRFASAACPLPDGVLKLKPPIRDGRVLGLEFSERLARLFYRQIRCLDACSSFYRRHGRRCRRDLDSRPARGRYLTPDRFGHGHL